jgi:hypothetical protein
MVESLKCSSPDLSRFQDSFGMLMPQATVEPVDFSKLPPKLRNSVGNDCDNCGAMLKIIHPDKTATYVLDIDRLDVLLMQEQIVAGNRFFGSGTIYIQPGKTIEYLPYVGYTYTFDGYRRRGYGTRRLHIMNALAQAKFGMPIYSSPAPRPRQRNVWEMLIKQGIAETGIFDGQRRYKFV